jgi:hypothetical protein
MKQANQVHTGNLFLLALLRSSHAQAMLCTFPAFGGTFDAMLMLVLFTFFCTGNTDISTKLCGCVGMIATEVHQLSGGMANGRTFDIELNTFCQHPYVFFFKACRSAMITGVGALHKHARQRFIMGMHKKYFINEPGTLIFLF